VCDHPDWWVILTLDGFSSHLTVATALQVFHDHKIMIVKEEGDTSAVNQPYDQNVAKSDKRRIREFLDLVRLSRPMIDQSALVVVCVKALQKVSKQMWISSFTKVNLHPDHRISFIEWIKKIDEKIEVGEHFFSKCNNSCFLAMPMFWQKLSIEARHAAISVIDRYVYWLMLICVNVLFLTLLCFICYSIDSISKQNQGIVHGAKKT
jgi:hypothetical protein